MLPTCDLKNVTLLACVCFFMQSLPTSHFHCWKKVVYLGKKKKQKQQQQQQQQKIKKWRFKIDICKNWKFVYVAQEQ